MESTYYIYGLVDPITDEVRYIGRTIDMKARLICHISEAKSGNTDKCAWIRHLLDGSMKPTIICLEEAAYDGCVEAETKWMEKHKGSLFNIKKTGHGAICKNPVGDKFLTIKVPPEFMEKLSEAAENGGRSISGQARFILKKQLGIK